MDSLFESRQRRIQVVGIPGKDLVTSCVFPWRFEWKDSFVKALRRLKQLFSITGKDLVTFVSHSVAVRLDGDSFFESVGGHVTRGASAIAPGSPGTPCTRGASACAPGAEV